MAPLLAALIPTLIEKLFNKDKDKNKKKVNTEELGQAAKNYFGQSGGDSLKMSPGTSLSSSIGSWQPTTSMNSVTRAKRGQ